MTVVPRCSIVGLRETTVVSRGLSLRLFVVVSHRLPAKKFRTTVVSRCPIVGLREATVVSCHRSPRLLVVVSHRWPAEILEH